MTRVWKVVQGIILPNSSEVLVIDVLVITDIFRLLVSGFSGFSLCGPATCLHCTPWVLNCHLLVSSIPIRCLGRHRCRGLFLPHFFLSNFSLEKLKCSDFALRYILCTVLLRTLCQGYPIPSAGGMSSSSSFDSCLDVSLPKMIRVN